ncbi:MAG: hypothetical protein RL338_518 [Chloroflexota bacterium]|jgi:uncharacterized membrane protein
MSRPPGSPVPPARRAPEQLASRALAIATGAGVAFVALGTAAAAIAGVPTLDTTPTTLAVLRDGLLAAEPDALLLAGMLALFSGPIVRLVGSAVAFLLAGDRRSAVLALAVVAAVALNVALAATGTRR